MGLTPRMFASNKESFVFQLHTMLFLLEKMDFDSKTELFKIAGIIYGSSFINCNDPFDDEWAKKVVDYAISLLD